MLYLYTKIKGGNKMEEYNRWNDPGIITVKRASEEESRKMRKETLQEMMDFFKDYVNEFSTKQKKIEE